LDAGRMEARVKHPMRIAVVATAEAGGMPSSVVRGFQQLGQVVELVPYLDWFPTIRSDRRGMGLINRRLHDLGRPWAAARTIAAIRRFAPDLVLVLKSDDLSPLFYTALRRVSGATIVAFHPDDPWNSGRGALRTGPAHANALKQMLAVDMMFLWSHALVAKARARGANAHYLAFACDPALHPPDVVPDDTQRAAFAADVVFVGNWELERERMLAPLAESGVDLAIWGTGYWRDRCKNEAVRKAWRGRPLMGEEQALAVKCANLSVNILRLQNKGSTNMRTFEVPCIGGFLLHEASDEAAAFFPVGEASASFDGPEGLVVAVKTWLAAPAARRASVAAEGQRRALALTYREWASTMLEIISEFKQSRG